MVNTAEPDWYADPTGVHHQRYWDGERWTARVADRFGATSAHHVPNDYPPPGREPRPSPVMLSPVPDRPDPEPAVKRSRPRLLRRKRGDGVVPPEPAVEHPADLEPPTEAVARDDRGDASGDDALVLAAQVLQRATEDAGFSWRDSDMTIDDAINALPVDIADNAVNLMHRLFATAGDDENARWTEAKLQEIKVLKRGYRKLHELVTSTPKEELFERSRRFGVPDDLTADFVDGVLSSEIPTVGELLTAQLPVGGPDAA